MEPDQAAAAALDDLKLFAGGPVEPVRRREQRRELRGAAGRARVRLFVPSQAVFSVRLRSGIRCRRSNALTCRGDSFRNFRI